jgi:putative exporter of polyketide antibiotics
MADATKSEKGFGPKDAIVPHLKEVGLFQTRCSLILWLVAMALIGATYGALVGFFYETYRPDDMRWIAQMVDSDGQISVGFFFLSFLSTLASNAGECNSWGECA